ncbi:hypothetical protein EUGRSUZ_H03699 [Eucalyptus grandis]|uniref:Uncharacterized protein n=2 Tax=Eucalyptus grandis TaxID=71139 RepID=A0ACC3JVF8_EUCGR|nr:hypothetical protein EUGRSUZ_H03699 [Eucalyptus grandis]
MNAGIRVYKDDREVPKGKKFGPELLQAINQSKISIPIFSKGYAFSVWCLNELVQMVECQKTRGQMIMPIFYDVAPSEVRHQTGGYGKAFLSHEQKKRYDEETMRQWKAALSAVGAIHGWDLHNMPNREEGEITNTVTQKVFNELKKAYLVVSDYLVNVDNHVGAIMEMIGAQTSETRIIGIYGMGGIGKTTIAKIIYNQLSHGFENCCFLPDIQEMSKGNRIPSLQNQLINDILKKKWTDIKNIDDGIQAIKNRLSNKRVLLLLDDVEKVDHMRALVGKGSKLIITTRNQDVLIVPEDSTYEVNGMDDYQSLQLFSKQAFRRDSPIDEYIDLSKRAVHIAGGLPLALEVIKNLKVLNLANCRCLKRTPNFSTHSNLERLILSKCYSLIEIDRSICQLKRLVFLDVSGCWGLQRLPNELGDLASLKYLSLSGCRGLKRLPNELGDLASLKYLSLSCCRGLKRLLETIRNLESLIELNMSGLTIKELPDSIKKLKNLKIVNMKNVYISKIHDTFWTIEKLEIIELSYINYDDKHVAIGDCIYENKSLRILRLSMAERIHAPPRLPESLLELELKWLREGPFPDLSNLANLKVLDLTFGPPNSDGKYYGLLEEPIPPWIGNLTKLESLKICFPWMFASSRNLSLPPHPRRLPRLPSNLSSLTFDGCLSLCSMDLSNLRKLSSLDISRSAVAEIEGLGCLENLRDFSLWSVVQLVMLPDLSKLNKLRLIAVQACDNLVEIQGEVPRFLDHLKIDYCRSLREFPDLFSLMEVT